MVLNIAFHGDWLRLTQGDDRHLDGRARDLKRDLFNAAPACCAVLRK